MTGKELQKTEGVTPAGLLEIAVNNNVDLDKMTKLMDLKKEWEQDEARKAYHVAMTAFKANPPVIIKDMVNTQYNSRYASLPNIVNNTNIVLSKHDLSANWSVSQGDLVAVTCTITHVLGHSESTTIHGPLDESGKKNDLQKIKSTVTYLKLSTFECITGIATSDGNLDDDGAASGDTPSQPNNVITTPQAKTINTKLNALEKKDEGATARFLKYMGVEDAATIPKSKLQAAMTALKGVS